MASSAWYSLSYSCSDFTGTRRSLLHSALIHSIAFCIMFKDEGKEQAIGNLNAEGNYGRNYYKIYTLRNQKLV